MVPEFKVDGKIYQGNETEMDKIFQDIMKELSEKSRTIKYIEVNSKDKVYRYEDIDKNQELKTIEIFSQTYRELCKNTLSDMSGYLDKLYEGYDDIIRLLNDNKITEAMTILKYALDGIDWMHQAFDKIIKLASIKLSEEEVNFIKKYSEHLTDLFNALNNEDYVSVKDIIEYDLKEDIKTWKEILDKYYEFIKE
jgi:hypothetical protein